MEQFEKDFTSSCETLLIKEGNKLCEEVITFLDEDEEFLIDKARTFCKHFIEFMEVNKLDTKYTLELKERCKKYLENVDYFYRFRFTLKEVNRDRDIKKSMKNTENVYTDTNYLLRDNSLKMTSGLNMNNKRIINLEPII